MAYPKKPAQLKIISGTTRKDRDNGAALALPAVTVVPKAPRWLPNAHAVKEFNRLAGVLFNNGLLLEGSVAALAHLAAIHGKLVSLWIAGEIPSGFMISQYRNLMNDFGLSPVSSTKIGGAVPVKKPNKFAGNGKKP
jgi:hypothetical protein